ncbi:hypothetical protein MRS44_018265 [Fusarium solani]|uniref:uncharacterized protein n=1 Tax=Fusarium solani TaxID=169388 RepID=UPI0032C46F0F|nr:hypothetical protein MRS44_018168 [Fusarium solani]KAJ3454371.1 hypothetical protein MRS44_018265 [Fusarium solani]
MCGKESSLDAFVRGAEFGAVTSSSAFGTRACGTGTDTREPVSTAPCHTMSLLVQSFGVDGTGGSGFPAPQRFEATYFSYVADEWCIRKHTDFNTYISKVVWDEQSRRWTIESKYKKR